MNKLKQLLIFGGLTALVCSCHKETVQMSLESSSPDIQWEIKPQADLEGIDGREISTPGYIIHCIYY